MRKLIVAVCVTAVLVFTGIPISAKTIDLEPRQEACIETAYRIGKEIYLYGDTWGETAASIAYQESHCGRDKFRTNGVVVGDINSKGKPRSLGVMQVQVPTARHVGRMFPHVFQYKYGDRIPTDEELTIDLLVDMEFNIRVGVHYFAWLLEYRNGDWNKAVLSYNRGTGQRLNDINDYVRKVKKWRKKIVLPFIRDKKLVFSN